MKQKQAFFTVMHGRVKFMRGHYNITSDAVLLADFAAKIRVGKILDVGVGTGGAALCLLAQSPDLQITGIDVSEIMLSECAENVKLNGQNLELIQADIFNWKTARTFDAVITNPPYFKGTPRQLPPCGGVAERKQSAARCGGGQNNIHHNTDLYEWTKACLKRVRPRGYFFTIVDATAAGEVIAALQAGRAGALEIQPLFGTKNTAERVLISARLGVKTGAKIYKGIGMKDKV